MRKLTLDVGSVSDVGKVRDINQDRIFIGKDIYRESEYGMFAVADGMGGMAQGEMSSSITISCLAKCWNLIMMAIMAKKNSQRMSFFEERIVESFFDANEEILEYGRLRTISLGTTISLLFIWKNKFFICHAGDSRIYKFNNNSYEQLTQDQTWVAQQVRSKLMTYEQAMAHPNKNMLSSCIGIFEKPNLFTLSGKVRQGDAFLICSDGFYRFISYEEIANVLIKNAPSQQAVLEMTGNVMKREASDNISAILVRGM